MNTNISVFTGRITKQAEMKTLANGAIVTTFSIAVNEKVKKLGTENEYENRPNFVDLIIWGNYGKALLPALTKGREVTATCRYHQDRWEKDGNKYSKVCFYVDNIEVQREPKAQQNQQQDGTIPQQSINPTFDNYSSEETIF